MTYRPDLHTRRNKRAGKQPNVQSIHIAYSVADPYGSQAHCDLISMPTAFMVRVHRCSYSNVLNANWIEDCH